MPSLPSWASRAPASAPASAPVRASTPATLGAFYPRPRDPNVPDTRLQLTAKCIYERQLPGGSYITAHVERLQSGYYDSPTIHEDCINNVRFVAVRFVFHEASTERRFKSARIKLTITDEKLQPEGIPLPPQLDHPDNHNPPTEKSREKPKFLRHAPHLLYGAMSPETLDWNFNLAGSLGVAQAPVSASINPSGGMKSSYKVFKMMKIQGSIRTNASWHGSQYDIEDGELVWTLEENELQKSGLPREFTFVMMLTKGHDLNQVLFSIDIDPEVASWFGHFPQWWVHLLKYQPLFKEPLDLDKEIGQRFEPCEPGIGFNFAGLMSTFDNFVTLPGTLYSTNDWSSSSQGPAPATKDDSQPKQPDKSPTNATQPSSTNNTVHLRIHVDNALASKDLVAVSSAYPYPDVVAKRKSSSPLNKKSVSPPLNQKSTPVPAPKTTSNNTPQSAPKIASSTPSPANKPSDLARRVTINGGHSTTPKYKTSRAPPLQTHYEEPQRSSDEEEYIDHDYEYAFPEFLYSPSKPRSQSQPAPLSANHRPSKSTSTTSSTAALGSKTVPSLSLNTGSTPAKTPQSTHSLRRSRSRDALRKASLTSQPEDEEAISAAMDMLSGSPPPPASAPPDSSIMIPSDDIVLATPRTRAALADRIEVERAEKARVERRNGNLNTESARLRDTSAGSGIEYSSGLTSRSRDRDRVREKRYSMPVTSKGIGYPGTGGTFSARDKDGQIAEAGARAGDANVGNGRSSLMIPIGPKHDSGLGIGIATTTPGDAAAGNTTATATANSSARASTAMGNTAGGKSGSFKRDGNSGVYSGYEYVE